MLSRHRPARRAPGGTPDGAPSEEPARYDRLRGPEPGALIGQYRILSPIGAGSMGRVYVGEHTLIGRLAAIKVLRPELSQRREIVDRFFNEARAAAAIKHPGIVQIFDFGFAADGSAYLVMELLDGASLAATLRERGALPALEALRVIRQIATAIARAHAAGVIHRDLKPDNLFLLPDPDVVGGVRVKILDFGVAKLSEDFEATRTQAGGLFGTPLYMAPEQFEGKVDERSDIYSLGCVMYESLVGTPPFEGGSLPQLLRAHTGERPAAPSRVRPALSPALDAIVLRCLEKDPAARFSSMTELAGAIEHALEAGSRAPTDEAAPDHDDELVPVRRTAGPAGGTRADGAPDPGSPPVDALPGGVDLELSVPARSQGLALAGAPASVPSQPGSAAPPFSPGSTLVLEPSSERGPVAQPRFAPILLPPLSSKGSPGELPARDALRPDDTVVGDPQPRPGAAAHGEDAPRVSGASGPLAAVLADAVPDGFRGALGPLVEFFTEMFATARRFADHVVELGDPAIEDLASRAHYVLFLDDITDRDAGPFGELATVAFRASVDPLTRQLAQLDTPPGSVLIVVLAAQLGQGARETIFALRSQRNLFVVPIAASEIRRECEAGNGRMLLINRIADLHTVSDPFSVHEDFIDPTRCIGFAAEVADLIRHITTGGKIVSVAGPPGSGKTSVVAMAEYGCDHRDVSRRFVRLSCGELTSFDPDTVIHELLEQIDRLDAREPGGRTPRGSVPPGDASGPTSMRETLLRLGARATSAGALQVARTQSGPLVRDPLVRDQLVIVLEDADWLIRLASSSEPDAARRQRARELWRGLARLCSDAGYTVIVTSVRDFQGVDPVPLERPVPVSRVPMRALSPRESDRLVVSLGELVGFCPDREALARLHHESGGNVYALRLLCSQVIRAIRERPEYMPLARLEVTADLVDEAARHIAATGSTFRPHVSVWLDDAERIVLQHIASERPRSPRRVRRALEGSADPERIGKALDGLELMGLVEFRRGRHRVRVPLFERWIDTHLEPPVRRRNAIREARASRVAIACSAALLLLGAYWTVLRSTRSAERATVGDCTFELDHPDRVGVDETFAVFVYQSCRTAQPHQLAIEPVLSSLHIPAPASDCTAATASCTAVYSPVAHEQAHDAYRVQLIVDHQPVASGAIAKDRFASVRSIGEKTVPQVAWVLPLLSVVFAFHKDLKRSVLQLIGRGGRPPDAPPDAPSPAPGEPAKP